MIRSLRASAPLRADLAGGTIDIWPLYLLHDRSSTVNVALEIRAHARFHPGDEAWELRAGDQGARRRVPATRVRQALGRCRPGDPFALVLRVLEHASPPRPGTIVTSVDGPPGGGIGGSSALMIALLGLTARMGGGRVRRDGMAALARDLEARVLQLPTGLQDYYPAIHGGVLQLHHEPGAPRVEHLPVDPEWLEAHLVLAFGGRPHASGPSNWSLYKRRLEGDPQARDSFAAIARAAMRAAAGLRAGNVRMVARAMNADWAARKALDAGLAPAELQRLETAGRGSGAIGAKGCGAASGGCMLFVLPGPSRRARVEAALEAAGARLLPARIARQGLRVRSVTEPGA